MKKNNFSNEKENQTSKVTRGGSGSRGHKTNNNGRNKSRTVGNNNTNNRSTGLSNSQLSLDVTRFPFSGSLGRKIDVWETNTPIGDTQITTSHYIPGVCAIRLAPSVGYTDSYNDPINLAARNLYAYVTHANSRNASYEANDLMLYVLAVAELFKMWQIGARVYGVARNYTPMNKYSPETIIKAMGFKPDSVLANLNDLRSQLNLLASKISSIVVPSNISYVSREFVLFSQLYADDINSRAQIYLFKPDGYWKYNETLDAQGGGLEYTKLPTMITVDEYFAIMHSLSDAILSSQYMNIMAADIIKAFGDSLYALNEVPDDYQIIPVYDEEMLEVISNITVTGSLLSDWVAVTQKIPADTNLAPYLHHTPAFKYNQLTAPMQNSAFMHTMLKTTLNTKKEELTPAETVDRTAFSPIFAHDAAHSIIHVFGRTEIPTMIQFYAMDTIISVDSPVLSHDLWEGVDIERVFSIISQFDWAPIMATMSKTTSGKYAFAGFLGDICNLSLISNNDMRALNDAVLQMLFSKNS